MYKTTLDNIEIEVQERDDWTSSIDENFKPGDYFDEDIAWDLIEAVPPHNFCAGYFQVGEAHSHRPDQEGRMRPTYLTLCRVKKAPEVWKFMGYCFGGSTINAEDTK